MIFGVMFLISCRELWTHNHLVASFLMGGVGGMCIMFALEREWWR